MTVTNSLQKLVETRLDELGLTQRAAARLAAEQGWRNSLGTINRIMQGKHTGNLTTHTIRSLARLLEVPPATVRAAAERTYEELAERNVQFPARFARLSPEARRVAEAHMDLLLAQQEQSDRRTAV